MSRARRRNDRSLDRAQGVWTALLTRAERLGPDFPPLAVVTALRDWAFQHEGELREITSVEPELVGVREWFRAADFARHPLCANGVSAGSVLDAWRSRSTARLDGRGIARAIDDALVALTMVLAPLYSDRMQADYYWCLDTSTGEFLVWSEFDADFFTHSGERVSYSKAIRPIWKDELSAVRALEQHAPTGNLW